jgi:hypothetical protein
MPLSSLSYLDVYGPNTHGQIYYHNKLKNKHLIADTPNTLKHATNTPPLSILH